MERWFRESAQAMAEELNPHRAPGRAMAAISVNGSHLHLEIALPGNMGLIISLAFATPRLALIPTVADRAQPNRRLLLTPSLSGSPWVREEFGAIIAAQLGGDPAANLLQEKLRALTLSSALWELALNHFARLELQLAQELFPH